MPASKRKRPAPPDSDNESEPSQPNRRHVHFKSSSGVGGARRTMAKVMESEEEEETEGDGTQGTGESEEARVTMAIAVSRTALGISYFSPDLCTLYVTEDIPINCETAAIDLARMLIEQVRPDLVLISSKTSAEIADALQETLYSMGAALSEATSSSASAHGPTLQTRPAREFSEAAGHAALLSLRIVQSATQGHSEFDDQASVSSRSDSHRRTFGKPGSSKLLSDTSSMTAQALVSSEAARVTLSSVACLLSYLARHTTGNPGGRWDDGIDVRAIELLSFDRFMHLPMSTLASLSIFSTESHASLHSSKTSEGLSLFGILDSCRTAQGRHLLRSWLQRPALEAHVIEARADTIECLGRPDNTHSLSSLGTHLKSTHSLLRVLGILEGGRARINDWQHLLRGLHGIIFIRESLTNLSGFTDQRIIASLLEIIDTSQLNKLGHTIDSVIDWDETKFQGGGSRICVKPRVDEALDELKTQYAGLEGILDNVAKEISKHVSPQLADEFTICYFPQLGYLCTVEAVEGWETKTIYEREEWDFQSSCQFATDTHVYYKSPQMRECDTHLGDLQSAICDREIDIIHALEVEVAQYDDLFRTIAAQLAELDCLVSLTEIASQGEWVRPTISDDNVIDIRGGRHPLVEACVDVFISNDTLLCGGMGVGCHGDDFDPMTFTEKQPLLRSDLSLLIVSGANFSGKSAYLKQVAVLVILAQIGSFVPAASATIGLCDAVFARVSTRESVSRGDSAFMIDLQQVSYMLRNCTKRSLLLIDEFGKGTEAGDGQGLFCGVIRHLAERGEDCPKTIVATHFHAVFTNELIPSHLPVGLAHMQVVLPEDFGGYPADASSFTYLYSLAPSLASNSHALACAALFGIPEKVRKRAEEVSGMLGRFEVLELVDVGMTEEEKQGMRETEDVVRRFLDADLKAELDDDADATKEWMRRLLGVEEAP